MLNISRMNRFTLTVLFLIVITILSMLIGQFWGVGFILFWNESRLYFSVIIPFAITFTILGVYFRRKNELTNQLLWKISLICAVLLSIYISTIGHYIAHLIVGDPDHIAMINIKSLLVWGTVFTLIFLPITTAVARLLIGIFYTIIRK